jgi:WD40 repeat protein
MDGTVSVWDLSGRPLIPPLEHEHPVMNAALSPDGHRLATFDSTGKGALWNLEDGQKIMELAGHTGIVPIVRFSGSGTQLLTSGSDSVIHIWDLISRKDAPMNFDQAVIGAEWSPDDTQLLVLTGDTQTAMQNNARPAGAAASSAATLVELRTGGRTQLETLSPPRIGRFRPAGKHIVLVSSDGKTTLYDATTGQADGEFNPNRSPVRDVAFSPDGQDLLVMHDHELSLWDLDVGDEIVRIPTSEWSAVGTLSLQTPITWNPFSPDGQWIVSVWPEVETWPRDPLKEALRQAPRPLSEVEKRRFSVDLIAEGSGR